MPAPGRRPDARAAFPTRDLSGDAPARSSLINPVDHLLWARSIARGVREDARFLPGSQEELELQQTAYVVVCEYAARFDPIVSYHVGAERVMVRAALTRRRGSRRPTGQRVYATRVTVVGIDVSEWVRDRCKALVADLKRDAALLAREWAARAAHDLAARFDASGAFRGWAAVEVRSRCRREAKRLRNAGLYDTARPEAVRSVHIEEVSAPSGIGAKSRCPNCLDVLAARAPAGDEDRDEPWAPCDTSWD